MPNVWINWMSNFLSYLIFIIAIKPIQKIILKAIFCFVVLVSPKIAILTHIVCWARALGGGAGNGSVLGC